MTRPHAQAMLAPVLENRHLRLELDPDTGSVISLLNRHSALEAIEGDDVAAPPWRIQLTRLDPAIFEQRPTLRGRVWGTTEIVLYFLKHVVGGTWEWSYESFEWSYDETIADGRAIDLVWRRADGIVVEGRVELLTGRTDAEFTVRVCNGSTQCVLAVEYPVLDGIRPLSEDSRGDELAHSVDGGFLFRAPHRLFGDPEIIEAWKHRRIIETTDPEGHPDEGAAHGGLYRLRGYPNGFEGCPMQFLAYYCREVGGFYFASHDPHNTEKMFHFYSSSARRGLTCSFVHYSWQWERGADLAIEYPTLVGALNRGTWFEAADRYREWATGAGDGHPDWCRRGTLRTRVDAGTASRWLVEDVGFNTFGIPISRDVSAWYDAIHRITDSPVLHITGHDWEGGAVPIPADKTVRLRQLLAANSTPSLVELAAVLGIPADSSTVNQLRDTLLKFRQHLWSTFNVEPMEYLPPTFDERNVATIRSNGDYLVPFLWRDFIGYGHDTEAYGCLAPITPFTNAFMCPATDYWKHWHARTDVAMIESGVDGIYYDVSASCATPTLCLNRRHDHPIGFGRQLVRAYEDVFAFSRARIMEQQSSYVPVGTEVIIENLISVVDFAQCRAGAGVQATMEGEEFVEWQKDGRAVKIPMFAYVYHEYGPVLCDGWAKLSPEYGDVFFEIAARVALEGGLVQLNYEFSSLELFDGMEGSTYQLAYTNQLFEDTQPYRVDPAKVRFLGEVADARTGFAKDYLAYGRMVAKAPILSAVPPVTLDWNHFNSVHGLRLEAGELTTESVVHVAWSDGGDRLGYLFVNLLPDVDQTITVAPRPSEHGLAATGYGASLVTGLDRRELGPVVEGRPLTIELPARRVVLLELTPPG